MILAPMVLRVIEGEGLNKDEVVDWVKKSARHSHEYGNRRFHDWVFEVQGEAVLRMVRFEPTTMHVDSQAKMEVYELCEDCEGKGCKVCGWWGEILMLYD